MLKLFQADLLSVIVCSYVLAITALVYSFSRRYMSGVPRETLFFVQIWLLAMAVCLFMISDHFVLVLFAWFMMGWLLSQFLSFNQDWAQAHIAARNARLYFLSSSVFLGAALGVIIISHDIWQISVLRSAIVSRSIFLGNMSLFLIILSACIQSALVPFHTWLISSMNAPTPVSALMHAGLINAGGLLLIRLSFMFYEHPYVCIGIVLVGALSAFIGSSWKLVQTDVKRSLACSTVAQMGFMIMQCGLGLYTAALGHLMLHGMYKAFYFFNAGSALYKLDSVRVQKDSASIFFRVFMLVFGGLLAIVLMRIVCGKPINMIDANLFIYLFVAIAGAQVAWCFSIWPVKRYLTCLVAFCLVLFLGILPYGMFARFLHQCLPIDHAQKLSFVHIFIAIFFVVWWLYIVSGYFINNFWLYMKLVNTSQPFIHTMTLQKRRR